MKRILLGIVALFLLMSCTGKNGSKKINEESNRKADSIAALEKKRAELEQARLDSIHQESLRQDSIEAEKEKKEDIYNQMIQIINKEKMALKADGGDPKYMEYFTSDLDKDGIPELWIADNSIHAYAFTKLYALKSDGKVKHIGDPAAYGEYHKGSNYLKFESMHQGGWIIIKYTLKNGKLIEKVLDEGSMWDENDPDYREMPKIKEPTIRPVNISNLAPLRKSFNMD